MEELFLDGVVGPMDRSCGVMLAREPDTDQAPQAQDLEPFSSWLMGIMVTGFKILLSTVGPMDRRCGVILAGEPDIHQALNSHQAPQAQDLEPFSSWLMGIVVTGSRSY